MSDTKTYDTNWGRRELTTEQAEEIRNLYGAEFISETSAPATTSLADEQARNAAALADAPITSRDSAEDDSKGAQRRKAGN